MSRYAVLFWSFILGFVLCIGQNLEAQEGEIVRLFDIQGNDFALTMHGHRAIHPIEAIRRGGITLERSGIVQTGPDTFMEILLIPSETLIRVAENTSLIYNGLDSAGNFEDFGLLYGRIQVIAGNRPRPIVIRGGGISTKIMEGDFGIDHLVEASEWGFTSLPLFRVNAFQGSAEFFPSGMGNQGLTVIEGESISIMGKIALDRNIYTYWDRQPDDGDPEPREIFSVLPPHPQVVSNRGKNTSLAMGLTLTIASVATIVISYPQFGIIRNSDLAQNINNAAFIPLSMGLLTTLGGILHNPSTR